MITIRSWKELERWSAKRASSWASSFPLVPLGELLRPRREMVARSAFAEHTPITIRFDGTVEARSRSAPFQGAMCAAHSGDFVFSKIDIRNGAFALLPGIFKRVVVTPEYPIYRTNDDRLDARYFTLVLRSSTFLGLLDGAASGTSGRKRVHPENFEEIEIPLPELNAQRALVRAYDGALAEAINMERRATEGANLALKEFETALGVTPPPDLPQRPLQIVRFRDVDRWSHEGILYRQALQAAGKPTELYPLVMLGDVIGDLENGWSPQCLSRPATAGEWGVLKLGAVSFGTFDQDENKALPSSLEPAPEIEVRKGDVLISRANVPRLVGACAFVVDVRPKLMLCDKIFRVVFARNSNIHPKFLAEILKLPFVRQQIETSATGTSPTMRNISKPALLELSFPLPMGAAGLKVQHRIVEQLEARRAKAAQLLAAAAKIRAKAWAEFLAAVFA